MRTMAWVLLSLLLACAVLLSPSRRAEAQNAPAGWEYASYVDGARVTWNAPDRTVVARDEKDLLRKLDVAVGGDTEPAVAIFGYLGGEGWELGQHVGESTQEGKRHVYWFKRARR